MTFARLIRSDWVAFVAALALLLLMATTWYSTPAGREARRVEGLSQPSGAEAGQVAREVNSDAKLLAQNAEKNAWRAPGALNRLILALLLATVILAVGAAYLRAAGRRLEPPWTPSSALALAATVTGLLLAAHALTKGENTTVEPGLPLALVALGVVALAAATSFRAEESGRAFRAIAAEPPAEGAGAPGAEPAAPPG